VGLRACGPAGPAGRRDKPQIPAGMYWGHILPCSKKHVFDWQGVPFRQDNSFCRKTAILFPFTGINECPKKATDRPGCTAGHMFSCTKKQAFDWQGVPFRQDISFC